ncbi:hypothetical protein PMZ80_007540 [Knufia obscura]|uniref:Ankyrin repeat protein n=1 Tax=Knufia obscura TaxID=1635080 RepID=A0ABR0RHM1_9EURO|nr:hypothetical protein PMZ80_007540 [Knufia obscura]
MGVKADRPGSLPPRAQLRKDLSSPQDITTLNTLADAVDRSSRNRENDLRVLLQVCAELGNERFVRTLLARKADGNGSTNTTLPSLLCALRNDHVGTVQLLLAHQARIDITDNGGKNALMYAGLYSAASLELVYKQGAELDARDKQGRTALLHAAASGKVEAIRWLLSKRADIAAADKKGRTAVMHAASGGHSEALAVLLGHRGPLEATDDGGRTALIYAASDNHAHTLQILLDYGAEPEAEDNEGKDALLHAINQHRHSDPKEEVILFLLRARGGIKDNAESFRYLRAAAITGQNAPLKLLLDYHANVNAKDSEGRSPLQCLLEEAAKTIKYSKTTISILLNAGADIGAENRGMKAKERTPFQDAAAKGQYIIVEAILEHLSGCLTRERLQEYIDRRSSRGKTALHLAAQNGHELIVDVLIRYGARLDSVSEGNWTPLLNAAKLGHAKVVEIILAAAGPKEVNARTSSGMTSLHWAAENGHKKVVELLLQDSRSLKNPKDTFNTTPLLRAGLHDHLEVFKLFRPHLLSGRISRHAQDACSMFTASVVDIYKKRNESRVVNKPMSVRKVLYDADLKDPSKFAITTRLKDIQEGRPDFRWIHLPANNLAWAEALITKMLIENGPADVPAYQFMLQLFGQQQHRGSKIHSRYMRPLCQLHPNKHNNHPRAWRRPTVSVTDSSILDARSSATTFVDIQNSPKPSLLSHSDTEDQVPDAPKEVGVLFMPYLHWETDTNRQLVRDAVQRVLSNEKRVSQEKRARTNVSSTGISTTPPTYTSDEHWTNSSITALTLIFEIATKWSFDTTTSSRRGSQ